MLKPWIQDQDLSLQVSDAGKLGPWLENLWKAQ